MASDADLTTAQRDALSSMRTHFAKIDGEGLPMSDTTYLRYLRARQFNAGKAQSMLLDTIKWRKDFDLKGIHDGWQSVIAEENATGKGYVRGLSTAGNALLYLRPKHENTFNHDGNLKHLVYNMERAMRVMEADGRGAEKLVLLIDYDGYSLLNAPPMKTSTETLSILQNHYPERLFRAYCIRPPWIFNAFWTMISPFIDPITYQKIVMVNGNREEIAQKLSNDGIPLSVLEASLGGHDQRPFISGVYLGRGQRGGGSSSSSGSGSVSGVSDAATFGSSPSQRPGNSAGRSDAGSTVFSGTEGMISSNISVASHVSVASNLSVDSGASFMTYDSGPLHALSPEEVFNSDYSKLADCDHVKDASAKGKPDASKGWFW